MPPGLPSQVSRGLEEAVLALCQNRSHVVVVANASIARSLPRLLARQIDGRAPVKIASLDERAGVRTIESLLAGFESNGILLIPDALDLDPAVLRRAGELSSRPGSGLRVALFADRSRAEIRDPAAELVQALGVGAERIDIGGATAPATPDLEVAIPARVVPPVVSPSRRRPRPIVVRSVWNARQRARRRELDDRMRWIRRALVLALPAILWAGSLSITPAPFDSPRRVVPASPPPVFAQETAARTPASLPVVTPEIPHPELASAASPEPELVEVASKPAKPSEPPPPPEPPAISMVPVSLNAEPWAKIEVDGVPLGPTPIADWPLAPGRHQIRASFPNGLVVERAVHVDAIENHFRIE